MAQKVVSIVIPIYKKNLTYNEELSFRRCLKILGKYPVTIVHPKRLDLSLYNHIAKELQTKLKYESFKSKYFKGVEGYNKLLLSLGFYKRYAKYEFIFIYQLDSWVFRDELIYWCKQGFDYIGAPWFEGWHEAAPDSPIIDAGNGGFSLRKTHSTIKLLKKMILFTLSYRILWKLKILTLCNKLGILKNFRQHLNKVRSHGLNEDYQISILSKHYKWYKIALYQDAFRFSFDANPETLYKMNKNKLPFGCHAWERYNSNFWRQFIEF